MPTYEYMCKQCGKNFDVVQAFSDKPLKKHDECGGELQKVFHARGIVFRGSGFYATDSKGRSSTGSSDTKAESTSSTNKEKKPEKSSSTAKAD